MNDERNDKEMSVETLASACDVLASVARGDDRERDDREHAAIVAAVAESAARLVEISQTYARGVDPSPPPSDPSSSDPSSSRVATSGERPGRLGRSLLRAVRAIRRFSVDHAVRSCREWWSCDPLRLIDTGPWDGLHLLLFLAECHARVCVAKLFSEAKRGWEGVVGSSPIARTRPSTGPATRPDDEHAERDELSRERVDKRPASDLDDEDDEDDLGEDDFVDDLDDEDVRETREALERGLEPRSIRALVSDARPCRSTMALVVCLDGVVPLEERERDVGMFNGTRPSRLGVRLLERHALATDATKTLEREIEGVARDFGDHGGFEGGETPLVTPLVVAEWTRRTIEVDANNALLLRMDEWAIVSALRPHEVAFATGERGSVPQEHRNSPAAWVAQRARTDEAYRELMKSSKRNVEHDANAYVCFSGTLEQHHAFEWSTRCLASRLSPVVALRKTREYIASARPRTAPLVIESANDDSATILYRSSRDEAFERRRVANPHQAVDAWMDIVARNNGGAYTRKANVKDVMERIKKTKTSEILEAPSDIGGASLRVN